MEWLSRPALCSALFSCAVHAIGLGLAAALVVASPPKSSLPVKITFIQRPVPLAVGERNGIDNTKGTTLRGDVGSTPRLQPQTAVKPVVKKKLTPPPAAVPSTSVVKKKLPKPTVIPTSVPPVKEDLTPRLALSTAVLLPADPFLDGTETGGVTTTSEATENAGGTPANGKNSAAARGPGTGNGSGEGRGGGNGAHPEYGVNPKPQYPLIARRLGAQGIVLLRVRVREDGSVAEVELARSSGFAMLDESASRTIRESWRFIPARVDGTPVESWVEVPIKFVLEDS